MSASFRPRHLLPLGETFADHLIHRGFHKRGRDPFPVPIAIPVVGNKYAIGGNIATELPCRFQQLLGALRWRLEELQVYLEVLNQLQSTVHVSMPQVPLEPFQVLLDLRDIEHALSLTFRSSRRLDRRGQALR